MSLYSWSVKLTTRQYFTTNPKTIHYNKSLYYQNYFEPTNFAKNRTTGKCFFFFKWESISWRRHNLTPALKLLENFLLFVNKQDLVLHCLLKKKSLRVKSSGLQSLLDVLTTQLSYGQISPGTTICALNSPRNWRGRRSWLKSTINSNKNSLEVLSWHYICFSAFYKEKKIENFAEFDFDRVWKCVN